MKFKFKIQQYQTEAVEAVVKVFEGQSFNDKLSYLRDLGKRAANVQQSFDDLNDDGSGFGNAPIELSDEQLLDNLRSLQLANNIKQSSSLSKPFGAGCRCALDIEMETGTGKTYCYIKTMFELNKKYGWSKFIVVVPSIAIREGVKKSFEVMEDHFFEQYGKKARYFIYNSKNLNQLDSFSASKDIYVMIINSQAFASSLKEGAKNEAARIIYSKQDSFGSRRPIDVIAANRPIIILDEPQKLGGDATQASLKLFKPLFSLNYSATHKDVHNLVYVLDALDAYQKKLVKKIEVKGFEQHNLRGTGGFVYLSQILLDPKKPPMARITFEARRANLDIERITRICRVDDNLYDLSAGKTNNPIEQYKNGFTIKEINPVNGTITFLNGEELAVGEAYGDMSEKQMRRIQIRETIESHFEKEEKLFNMGIKCLSLFFIDEVANYRQYDENGNEVLGDFGVMFEQEYNSVLNEYIRMDETPYIKYLKSIDVQDTHKGYFSIDKKTNRAVNSVEKRGVCDDISAYNLILKNKERLLSFGEPTRFIFSHSALREGWDNPNVFQICTLKQSNSEISKRQEVGRGMRLCVNQSGDRMDLTALSNRVHDVNTLTIIASESYKTFAGDLQRELKSTLYDRPTKATIDYFTDKVVNTANGSYTINKVDATDIIVYLRSNGYVDRDGNVTDVYRDAQANGTFADLPVELAPISDGIHKLIQGIFDEKVLKEMVSPTSKTKIKQNELNENFFKKEFQELWKRINHKYAYTVNIDSDKLIERSIKAIDEKLVVTQTTYQRTIGSQGDTLDFNAEKSKTITLKNGGNFGVKYDLIGKICVGTSLTRKTVVKILKGIANYQFARFKDNPEDFITKVTRLINEQKADMIVDAISYNLTDEVFDNNIFACGAVSIDINAKVIENYCYRLKLSPFKYVNFSKRNLFLSYDTTIQKIKMEFNEHESLGGIISSIRMHKLFYALNMEYYGKLKLNFELVDLPKKEIISFNKRANAIVSKYNRCDCTIEIFDNMFDDIINGLQIKTPVYFSLVDQEDLFYGFIAHLYELFNFYGITDEDLKWYKDNSYRQHKLYPDNVTLIINICMEEYIGSLMCNYFQSNSKVSYWDNQIYLGYSPMKYEEEQIKLCTPLNTYNEITDKLDLLVLNRLNESYKGLKDAKWADSRNASFKSIKSILMPYCVNGVEWVMLGCYITNHTFYKGKERKKNYSQESIIVNCATNYSKNRSRKLDSYMTIEIENYKNSVYDYINESSDFCKLIAPINSNHSLFDENNLSFPSSTIISKLGLSFDSKIAAWVNDSKDIVILCNNSLYRLYKDDIGRTIYIKKEYFEKIKDVLQLYYYIFTGKLSYETGYYSNQSDMHIIIKNGRIRKVCKNNGKRETETQKIYKKCYSCPIYEAYVEQQLSIQKSAHFFDEFFN